MSTITLKKSALSFIGIFLVALMLSVSLALAINKNKQQGSTFMQLIEQDCKNTERLLNAREGASWNSEYGKSSTGVASTLNQCY